VAAASAAAYGSETLALALAAWQREPQLSAKNSSVSAAAARHRARVASGVSGSRRNMKNLAA